MTKRILVTLVVLFSVATSLYAASRAEKLTKKPAEWFRSKDGEKALSAILSWQSEHGDWPKRPALCYATEERLSNSPINRNPKASPMRRNVSTVEFT